jgi:hypothetical protein
MSSEHYNTLYLAKAYKSSVNQYYYKLGFTNLEWDKRSVDLTKEFGKLWSFRLLARSKIESEAVERNMHKSLRSQFGNVIITKDSGIKSQECYEINKEILNKIKELFEQYSKPGSIINVSIDQEELEMTKSLISEIGIGWKTFFGNIGWEWLDRENSHYIRSGDDEIEIHVEQWNWAVWNEDSEKFQTSTSRRLVVGRNIIQRNGTPIFGLGLSGNMSCGPMTIELIGPETYSIIPISFSSLAKIEIGKFLANTGICLGC